MGSAFTRPDAKQELDTVASSPPESHVFQVESFDALETISQNLQDQVISSQGKCHAYLLTATASVIFVFSHLKLL